MFLKEADIAGSHTIEEVTTMTLLGCLAAFVFCLGIVI
jgi:hypothetical protein